jgi:hypothetical protein
MPLRAAISIARFGPFSGAIPTEERKIATGLWLEGKQIARQSVMDGADPVRMGQIPPLVVRNRDQREVPKRPVEGREIRQVQSPVLGRQSPICEGANERRMQNIDVEVKNIELVDPLSELLQHDDMVDQRLSDGGIEA